MFSLNIYPFGNISIRVSDALYQYPSFFEGLKNFNIFTFNIGLGENFYPIFTTYLNNPLNLFYFFFKKENFDLFFIILLLIKFGLMGLTMNILLNYKKKINQKSIIFSTIYALSGFTTFYYWNYQFLDAVYMLPLIMIGIDKLINNDKNLMYYLTLTYMILIHYYTAYMICLFSVIYFFFLLYNSTLDKKRKKKKIIEFFITSLFCGLTSAFILIPTIFSLFQGRSSYINNINFLDLSMFGIEIPYKFMIGSNYMRDIILAYDTSAPLYISIFLFVLLFLFIFKTKKSKYKKSVLVVLIIYFLSLISNMFYYIWHLFQKPVGIPGRFIFCFNAFLILILYNFDEEKKKEFKRINIKNILIIFILILLSFILKNYFYFKISSINNLIISFDKIYLYILILSFILIIYYSLAYFKDKCNYITYFLVILELTINLIININVNFQYDQYDYLYVNENKQELKENENIINKLKNNNNFFRINFLNDENAGLIYNFYGVNRFASIYNENLNNFLKYYRDERNQNHALNYKNDFLIDSLIDVKYVYDETTKNISENKYVINSLGFLVSNVDKNKLKNNDEIVNILNDLTNNKYDLELKRIKPEKILNNVFEKDSTYELINHDDEGKIILIYNIEEDIIGKININPSKYNVFNIDENGNIENILKMNDFYKYYLNDKEVLNIGSLKKGDTLKIEVKLNNIYDKVLYFNENLEYVNELKFKNLIEDLNMNIIKNIIIKNNGFEGEFESLNENILILTIPYDDSIEIKIDNEKVNFEKCLDGIICLNVNEGNHKIDMIYHVKDLKIGLFLSIISFLIFIFLNKKY